MATSRAARLVPARYLSLYTDYVNLCSESVLRLQDIWENCGHPESIVDKKMNSLFSWLGARWKTIIEDELQRLENMKSSLQLRLTEMAAIYKKLELAEPVQPSGLNLRQQLEWVEGCSEKADQIGTKRRAEFEELRRRERMILNLMTDKQAWGEITDDSIEASGVIPTESQLESLSMHVSALLNERKARLERLRPMIEEARDLMERIGKVPKLAIEDSLLSLSPDRWDLNKANIELANNVLVELQEEEAKLHARHAAILQRLQQMFDRLEVQQAQREQVLGDLIPTKTYQAVGRLEELETEYKALVKANLVGFIEKLKIETTKYYEELRVDESCHLPSEIEALSSEGPSERLVEVYEKHIDDLKSRRRSLMPLFKLLDDWQQMKEDFRQLEDAQKDPQRFKNRGGALLQQTKKRDRIYKNLPLLASQISKFLDAYEPAHGRVLVYGKTVRELLETDQLSDRSRSGNASSSSSGLRTPLKSNAVQSTAPLRTSTLRRAGSTIELKSSRIKANSVRQPDRMNSLASACVRKTVTKNPENSRNGRSNDKSGNKRTLRRSFSYDDFEDRLRSNELESTRVTNSNISAQRNRCRLIF